MHQARTGPQKPASTPLQYSEDGTSVCINQICSVHINNLLNSSILQCSSTSLFLFHCSLISSFVILCISSEYSKCTFVSGFSSTHPVHLAIILPEMKISYTRSWNSVFPAYLVFLRPKTVHWAASQFPFFRSQHATQKHSPFLWLQVSNCMIAKDHFEQILAAFRGSSLYSFVFQLLMKDMKSNTFLLNLKIQDTSDGKVQTWITNTSSYFLEPVFIILERIPSRRMRGVLVFAPSIL